MQGARGRVVIDAGFADPGGSRAVKVGRGLKPRGHPAYVRLITS